jgi:hypothetical protein
MTKNLQLPWSRQEIIDAMVAEFRPYDFDDPSTWAVCSQMRALMRLAVSGRGPLGFGAALVERWQGGRQRIRT